MRLHRFFVEGGLEGKNEIKISNENLLHQLRDVFRLGTGDQVIFFDGKGVDYIYKIKLLAKNEGGFEKIREMKAPIPRKKITLFLSMIKKENFELVCEKATELGVSEIVPIISERTLVKNLNMKRLQKIIIEASEQCGRGDVPILGETKKLADVLDEKDLIVFDSSGKSLQLKTDNQKLLIGPEGGWSDRELSKFREKNIPRYSLGPLTLRAETAAIAAVSACAFLS